MLLPFLAACFNQHRLQLLWQAPIASETTPLVQNGTVYVTGFRAGHPEEARRLFALDLKTGQQRWVSADSIREVYGESGGYVFCHNTAEHLIQLDARSGEKIYESSDNDTPILHWQLQGDTMFLINAAMEVVAVDNRKSQVLWRFKLPFKPGDDTDLHLSGTMLIASGNFRNTDHQFGAIHALDAATGKQLWYFETPPPHDYAPLQVLVSAPYILATNTAPMNLQTHVLDAKTGVPLYPPVGFFDVYGCLNHLAYASNGIYDLRSGQKKGDTEKWILNSAVYHDIAWQRQVSSVGPWESFFLRNTYDGDYRGRRDWTNTPPNSALEGFDVATGKSVFKTKAMKFTQFSNPVEAEGLLLHTSIAVMKEGKSGVWAYKLP